MATSVNGSINSLKLHRYGVIYADPPWPFRNWSAKGTGRNAVSHYDCLNFEELASLPVADIAADDCALFLWPVDPLLARSEGFFTGLGYWTRANREQCLLAMRGKPRRRGKDCES
jgi:N6-adenosine-specific RNA methylase IME4